MQIMIDIPEKEFGIDIEDKFQVFFKRLEAETKEHMISGTNFLCGNYELETIQMFIQAFANGISLPKGHGRLLDEDQIPGDGGWDFSDRLMSTPTIIEADSEKVFDETELESSLERVRKEVAEQIRNYCVEKED